MSYLKSTTLLILGLLSVSCYALDDDIDTAKQAAMNVAKRLGADTGALLRSTKKASMDKSRFVADLVFENAIYRYSKEAGIILYINCTNDALDRTIPKDGMAIKSEAESWNIAETKLREFGQEPFTRYRSVDNDDNSTVWSRAFEFKNKYNGYPVSGMTQTVELNLCNGSLISLNPSLPGVIDKTSKVVLTPKDAFCWLKSRLLSKYSDIILNDSYDAKLVYARFISRSEFSELPNDPRYSINDVPMISSSFRLAYWIKGLTSQGTTFAGAVDAETGMVIEGAFYKSGRKANNPTRLKVDTLQKSEAPSVSKSTNRHSSLIIGLTSIVCLVLISSAAYRIFSHH